MPKTLVIDMHKFRKIAQMACQLNRLISCGSEELSQHLRDTAIECLSNEATSVPFMGGHTYCTPGV